METTSLTPRATNNQWHSLVGNNLIPSTVEKNGFSEQTVLHNTLDIYIINQLCAQFTGYRLSQP